MVGLAKKFIIAVLFLISFIKTTEASLPLWSKKDLSLEATVIKADEQKGLVVLNRGLSEHFRIGAFCDAVILEQDKEDKFETLLIIEATQEKSVAMKMGDFNVEPNSKFRLRLINR